MAQDTDMSRIDITYFWNFITFIRLSVSGKWCWVVAQEDRFCTWKSPIRAV